MSKLSSRFSVSLLLKLMFWSIAICFIMPATIDITIVLPPVIRMYISAGFVVLGILGYIASFSSIVYLTLRKQ